MNPNTMTVEECFQWLDEFTKFSGEPSLDALDRARPEGWDWTLGTEYSYCGGKSLTFIGYHAAGTKNMLRKNERNTKRVSAPDRLTCEARLVVSMWLAESPSPTDDKHKEMA